MLRDVLEDKRIWDDGSVCLTQDETICPRVNMADNQTPDEVLLLQSRVRVISAGAVA